MPNPTTTPKIMTGISCFSGTTKALLPAIKNKVIVKSNVFFCPILPAR